MTIYDVAIIGAGMAGSCATFKIAQQSPKIKALVLDLGRPPMKRRRQLEGWLGCLPNSDGKLYYQNVNYLSRLVGEEKAQNSYDWFIELLSQIGSFKMLKDKPVTTSLDKKIKKHGYRLEYNDYIQLYPKDIHALSKYMNKMIEKHSSNIQFKFDTEVLDVKKEEGIFIIRTDEETYQCKKLIISVGRSGWRWATNTFKKLDIVSNNDIAKFGIRVEISSSCMKDFNKSNCSLYRDNIEIGPLSWSGTVIPEDHVDLAISSFRSNENRWKSDKTSFNFIGNISFPKVGAEQTDRLAKLAFLLSNDRIIKEKISTLINGKSKISIVSEYDWLKESLNHLNNIIPDLLSKGYLHIPTIVPTVPKIHINNQLLTPVENLFVAGESTGIHGLLGAAMMGSIVADSI